MCPGCWTKSPSKTKMVVYIFMPLLSDQLDPWVLLFKVRQFLMSEMLVALRCFDVMVKKIPRGGISSSPADSSRLSGRSSIFVFPYHPCMVYLPTFWLFFNRKIWLNVGKYTIHGWYGIITCVKVYRRSLAKLLGAPFNQQKNTCSIGFMVWQYLPIIYYTNYTIKNPTKCIQM